MAGNENRQNRRQGNMNDQVSVDVNALTLSLTEEFKQLHPVSRERCIYRVPKRLKELNEKAYTPQCVSIGPYHHGKDELKAMEEHKTMYLQHFLELTKVSLERFVSCVMNNETRLRNCYQERIDLSSEKFVRMMLVDAVFVIMVMLRRSSPRFDNEDELLFNKSSPRFDNEDELLFNKSSPRFDNEDELLFNKPWMIYDIRKDMILLENQLPFFILDEFLVLSDLLPESYSVVRISSRLLSLYSPWVVNLSRELNFTGCKHLVDFIRIGQQPLEHNKYKTLNVMDLPSAVELHQAGVKFKCGSVDINFRDGILEIPLLKVLTFTEILLRNLQAFEQCQFRGGYFNDYIIMINLLITSGKDVEFLTKKGILENLFHDNELVVHLLNNLGKDTIINTKKFYFSDVVNDLNKYCGKRRNRWRASLIQNYFHTPWAAISVIAATIAILLTIVQTIFSILKVMQQQ